MLSPKDKLRHSELINGFRVAEPKTELIAAATHTGFFIFSGVRRLSNHQGRLICIGNNSEPVLASINLWPAMYLFSITLILTLAAFPAHAQDWQPREEVKSYAITGRTGPELYASIGERGPQIGKIRTIALTNWSLKWRRDYQPDGNACVLKSAIPFLTISYSLPKPAEKLTGANAANWKTFSDGIAQHERAHGRDIITMVDEIIAATLSLREENDPGCKAIRTQVLKRVTAANEAYKAKSRAFDKAEMADGGNVQRLILALVNGR